MVSFCERSTITLIFLTLRVIWNIEIFKLDKPDRELSGV